MNFIRSFFTSAVRLSPEAKMANVKEVERIINNNNVGMFFCSPQPLHLTHRPRLTKFQIVVFSKTWCPYCKAAKAALNESKANYEVVELDNRSTFSLLSNPQISPSKV